ncbi:hypothetical protein BDV95DRAFT_105006 [Massariosphaeria phaeospora]|uniref:Ankyrin repeat-containing domain protein n=1 Tax=Massariosphaeria phaeospora TaxID=100035 RepID=A0A7C8M9E0_9PLEO|nr:hypothetical protein BDV95DRAFT_105006 [Massariosphaeria phaeospora]
MDCSLGYLVFLLLFISNGVAAAGDEADELGFNLFTDLAPLLALFGEQFARQFMSESLLWLDHVVFAMVPLGILTAVVGAIRVSGPPWARAFIGRARESRAAAEIQLMSSTSDEVCEVYNGKAIVRATGQPTITQLLLFPTLFKSDDDSCGLHTLESAYNSKPPLLEMRHFGVGSHRKKETNHKRSSRAVVSSREKRSVVDKLRRRNKPGVMKGTDVEAGKPLDTDGDQERAAFPVDLKHAAPNLQLNLPYTVLDYSKSTQELWAASFIAVAIQAAVVIVGAATSYNNNLRDRIAGDARGYGFPLFASGTLCLNFGMMICSWVIERGTKEYVWRKVPRKPAVANVFANDNAEPQKSNTRTTNTWDSDSTLSSLPDDVSTFHLVWLQRKHTVNDQAFDSYLIFGGRKRELLTSTPNNYEDWQRSSLKGPTQLAANRYELVTICGSFLSVVGFILQFEGLRGLTWPTAVAQIGSILVMALIRAFLRRHLGDRPSTLAAKEDYELDWLAQRLVLHDYPLDGLSTLQNPECPQDSFSWKVMTIRDRPGTRFLAWDGQMFDKIDISVPSDEEDTLDTPGTTADESAKRPYHRNSQTVLKVRQRLGYLAKSPGVASKEAVALAHAIGLVLNEVYPPISKGDHRTFEWYLDTRIEKKKRESQIVGGSDNLCITDTITLQANGDHESGWSVHSPDIDAVLSLWMASYDGNEDVDNNHKPSDWLAHSDSGTHKFRRVLGENPAPSSISYDSASVLSGESSVEIESSIEIDGSVLVDDTESEESISLVDVERGSTASRDSSSHGSQMLKDFKTNQTDILTRDLNLWIDDPRVVDLFGVEGQDSNPEPNGTHTASDKETESKGPGLVIGYHGIEGSPDGGKVVYIESNAPLARILSQHMFSAFMWAISSIIDPEIFAHTTVEEGERSYTLDLQQSWTFPKLRNARMLKIARGIAETGLGTTEDVLFCIIPPLSYRKLLPNEALLEPLLREAKEFESRHDWRNATVMYQKLLELELDPDSRDQIAFEIVIEVVEFLFIAVEVVYDRDGLDTSNAGELNVSAQDLISGCDRLLSILREQPLFLSVIQNLRWFYFQQRRQWHFNLLFPRLKIGIPDANENIRSRGPSHIASPTQEIRDLVQFTYFHQGPWSSEARQSWQPFQRDRALLYSTTDKFGWTPLHYAAVGCFNDNGDTESIDKLCELWSWPPHHELRDKSGRTPLHHAAMHMPLLLETLVERNVVGRSSFDIRARDGSLPIHSAARHGNLPGIKLLEKFHPSEKAAGDAFGRSTLHHGAISDRIEVVNYCLSKDHEIFPSADELSRRTPLQLAFVHNCKNALPKLLFRDLKLDTLMVADAEGVTAVDLLITKVKPRLLESLSAQFPEVVRSKGEPGHINSVADEPTKCFIAIMSAAIRLGRMEAIRLLFSTVLSRAWGDDLILEAFTKVESNARFDLLPSLLATVSNFAVLTIEELNATRAPFNNDDEEDGDTDIDAMEPFARTNRPLAMISSLTGKIKRHLARQSGPALLRWAIQNLREDFVDLIAELREADLISDNVDKVDWDLPDQDGNAPLSLLAMGSPTHRASTSKNHRRLLGCIWGSWSPEEKKAALQEAHGDLGMTLLMHAAGNGYDTLVEAFIDAGADMRAVDSSGQSALYHAMREQRQAVCDTIIRLDPEIVNVRIGLDGSKHTLLSRAVVHGQAAVVRLIAQYENVDPNIADSNGITPLAWCIGNDAEKMASVLRESFPTLAADGNVGHNPLPTNTKVSNTSTFGLVLGVHSIIKTANDISTDLKNLPEEIRLFDEHIFSMTLVLRSVEADLMNNAYSFVHQQNQNSNMKRLELTTHLRTCEVALKRTLALITTYRNFRHISDWDKYRWSNKGKKEIAECKSDLVLATSMLDLFLSKQGLNVLWKLESMMEKLSKQFGALEVLQPTSSTNMVKPIPKKFNWGRLVVVALVIGKFRIVLRRYRAKKLRQAKPRPRRPPLRQRSPQSETRSISEV